MFNLGSDKFRYIWISYLKVKKKYFNSLFVLAYFFKPCLYSFKILPVILYCQWIFTIDLLFTSAHFSSCVDNCTVIIVKLIVRIQLPNICMAKNAKRRAEDSPLKKKLIKHRPHRISLNWNISEFVLKPIQTDRSIRTEHIDVFSRLNLFSNIVFKPSALGNQWS